MASTARTTTGRHGFAAKSCVAAAFSVSSPRPRHGRADVRNKLKLMPALRRLARIAAALLTAGALAGPGPALAEGHGGGHGHGGDWEHGGGWGHAAGGPRGYEGPPGRGGGHWVYGPPPRAYAPYPGMPIYPRRGPPPGYGVRRGGLIPPQYRGAIVPDYGRHRLRPPPPGFAWVRMGHGYALVSEQTGQIFDVIGD